MNTVSIDPDVKMRVYTLARIHHGIFCFKEEFLPEERKIIYYTIQKERLSDQQIIDYLAKKIKKTWNGYLLFL